MPNEDIVREGLFLTVKSKPQEGESLSSYIVRVAEENGISVLDVGRFINGVKKYHFSSSLYFKLDLAGEYIDIDKLSEELEVDSDTLKGLTFTPLLKFFSENGTYDRHRYMLSISKEVNTKTRRYCPLCIENGIYNLIWQVSGVSYCNKHHIPLENTCHTCKRMLPYIFETMSSHTCLYCGETLTLYDKSKDIEAELMEQRKKFENWDYLLNGNHDLKLCQSRILGCLLLFVLSKEGSNNIFNIRRINHFGKARVKGLAAYIRNPQNASSKKPNLQDILKVCSIKEISVEDLFNSTVPRTFVDSFSNDSPEFQIGECFSPWCRFYQTVEGMSELITTAEKVRNIQKRRMTYKQLYACTGCYMRYGRDNAGAWKEVENRIETVLKARQLFNQGHSRNYVQKKLGVDSYRANEYLGYSLQQNILNEEIAKKYIPLHTPNDLVEKFIELNCSYSPNYQLLERIAKEKYGWSKLELYYFAFEKDVQEYQLFRKVGPRYERPSQKELFRQKIETTLKNLYEEQQSITIDRVAKETRFSINKIIYHGLSSVILQYKEKQLQERRKQNEQEMFQKYETYKMEVLREKSILLIRNVSRHLGLSQQEITKKYPELAIIIVNDVKESKLQADKSYIEQKEIEINDVINIMTELGDELTIKEVSKAVGIDSRQSIRSQRDSHLMNLIRNKVRPQT